MGGKITPNYYVQFLKKHFRLFDEQGRVTREKFKGLVAAEFGTDERTVRKHISNMCLFNIIIDSPYRANVVITPDMLAILREERRDALTKDAKEGK